MLKYAQACSDQVHRGFRYRGRSLACPFPWWRRLFGSAYQFLNTGLRQNDEFAFHALAIDEHRKAFAPTLWSNQGATHAAHRPIERTEQRWFIRRPRQCRRQIFSTDPLPQLPFRWLARQAESLGLSFSGEFAVDPARRPLLQPIPIRISCGGFIGFTPSTVAIIARSASLPGAKAKTSSTSTKLSMPRCSSDGAAIAATGRRDCKIGQTQNRSIRRRSQRPCELMIRRSW